jgi:hypothetical protein
MVDLVRPQQGPAGSAPTGVLSQAVTDFAVPRSRPGRTRASASETFGLSASHPNSRESTTARTIPSITYALKNCRIIAMERSRMVLRCSEVGLFYFFSSRLHFVQGLIFHDHGRLLTGDFLKEKLSFCEKVRRLRF